MEKLVSNRKKEIRAQVVDSLHTAVQTLGITKPKRKLERMIIKSARRIAELVAEQIKKDSKKIKEEKIKNEKSPKVVKSKKVKKLKEPDLEIA